MRGLVIHKNSLEATSSLPTLIIDLIQGNTSQVVKAVFAVGGLTPLGSLLKELQCLIFNNNC